MFLTKLEIHKEARVEIDIDLLQSKCGTCKLHRNCKSPKMEYSGEGAKKILVIGDTPSDADDQNSIQFSGASGSYLKDLLLKGGISLNRDCWKVNAVRCNNSLEELNNTAKLCSGYILKLLYTLKPTHVLILGSAGIVSLFGDDFNNREVQRWRGVSFPDDKFKTRTFITYHPSEIKKNSKDRLLAAVFERDIVKFCSTIKYASYIEHYEYEKHVKHLLLFTDVKRELERILRDKPEYLYHDYETSGLKPYSSGHFVASISFAYSENQAFVFPLDYNQYWKPEDLRQIKELWCRILSDKDIGKIAHNIKFEDSWSTVTLKQETSGWIWDTQMAAHILDNRKQWSGLKFQVFIELGVRPYDKFIDPFIHSDTEFNTVHKSPLKELLMYCGLDSLFGFKLFNKQKTAFSGRKGLLFANDFFMKGTLCMSRIQQNGIITDEEYYRKQKLKLTYYIKKIRRKLTTGREAQKFFERFQRHINLASGPDLGKLFYEVLGRTPIYTGNVNAKGEQNYKTDAKTLSKLNLPYVDKLIEMRKLIKARDTYFAQFAREVHDGVMHPFFDLGIPVSYRSSSSKPNWQNLPKRNEKIKKAVRSGIKPRKRRVLSEIDFSGAEVITSSSYHKDPTFIAYLKDKSTDMHRDQALDIWQLDRSELENPNFTREEKARASKIRFYAKNNWTFAQFYGDWYDSCARMLWENCIENEKLKLPSGKLLYDHCKSVGVYTVEDLIEHCKKVEDKLWNERFPVYTRWKKNIVKFYEKHGFIETYLGFRFIGYMDRKQCANYPIQGTSFHLLVYTLLEVEKFIKKNKLKTLIIGQIHDSIVMDIPTEEVDFVLRSVVAIIGNLHTKFKWLALPMEAECSISKSAEDGGNFSDMYDVKPKFLNGEEEFNFSRIYEK